MKKIFLTIGMLMFFAVASHAQMDNWKTVASLPKDQRIVVDTKSGKTIRGKFQAGDDAKLSVMKGGKVVDLKREDVKSVYIGKKKKSYFGGVIGAVTGVLVGGVAAAAIGGDDVDDYASGTLALGGLIGGGILGQKAGAKIKKNYLIYQAP
jgi:uncharacterized protein YcfJ